jgi:hypothetical protein
MGSRESGATSAPTQQREIVLKKVSLVDRSRPTNVTVRDVRGISSCSYMLFAAARLRKVLDAVCRILGITGTLPSAPLCGGRVPQQRKSLPLSEQP